MLNLCLMLLSFAALAGDGQPKNLISNPGFESSAADNGLAAQWKAAQGSPQMMNDGGRTGERYLRMLDDGPKSSLLLESRRIAARPGGEYSAAVWMRTADHGQPGVYINFYNGLGRRILERHARADGPTDDWVQVDVSATAPPTAATVSVSLYSFRGDHGTFDFDDAELHVAGGGEPLSAPRVKPTAQEAIDIGSRRELFVERYLIDGLDGARLALHRPCDEGPVLTFGKPWEGEFCGYCTIIKTGAIKTDGGYRVYYRGATGEGKDGGASEVTCVAKSKDGIVWTKPKLGLFEVNGSTENNIVLAGMPPYSHNFSPWLDTRPGVTPAEQYKAMCGYNPKGLALFVSLDGFRWKLKQEHVINSKTFAFDSQSCTFWSELEQCYVCYFRTWKNGVRWVSRATSQDCLTWTKPVEMTFGDAPPENLYTNQTQPYFRAPHLYVATPARFMPNRQVLTEQQAHEIHVNPSYFKDVSDTVFMSSRGGNSYDRTFMSSFIRPGIGANNWVSRTNYPALNVVPTGPTEMSIYVNQDYAQPTAHLHRYSLRLDGFTSVRAEYDGGELLTRPLIFSGKQLAINFATSAAGGIRVEIQTPAGQPIPGFSFDDCQVQIGNEIERIVTWQPGADLSAIAGKAVRLRFVMKDADLYAIQFKKGN